MPVTVNVGEILTCAPDDIIRTRGCDPCVALIVIYENEKKCAHFSVNISGKLTQQIINDALNPILMEQFPLLNIILAGFSWGGKSKGMGGDLIFNRLKEYFSHQQTIESETDDSLSTTNGNDIHASNLATWQWTNNPASNELAELA